MNIKEAMKHKEKRKYLCSKSFRLFFVYYFQRDIHYRRFAQFHKDRFKAVESNRNIFCKGMRGVAKTTILGIANVVRRIVYKKNHFFCLLCYDKKKAKAMSRLIANELLTNNRLKEDFGSLFILSQTTKRKEEDGLTESGVSEFTTTNGCKVKSFGMGEPIRGELFDSKEGKKRPDFILLDDIDNNKNTRNKSIIDEDFFFIESEVFSGLDLEKNVKVRLGNVIRKDGRNVRQEIKAKGDQSWITFDNFLYGTSGTTEGELCRSKYVHTMQEEGDDGYGRTVSVERLKNEMKSGFLQNALGIAKQPGERYYKSERIKYSSTKDFDDIIMGLDPAFSLKEKSDAFGIVIVGKKGDNYTIIKTKQLEGEEKNESNILKTIQLLYNQYLVSRIKIETNNGGSIYARKLRDMGFAVEDKTTSKDKITVFMENQAKLEQNVRFDEDGCEDLIEQLLDFTGEEGNDDDLVDALMRCIEGKSIYYF